MVLQTSIHWLFMNLLSFWISFRNDALYVVRLHVRRNLFLFRDFCLHGTNLWLGFARISWIRRWSRILDVCAAVAGFGGENMKGEYHGKGVRVWKQAVSLFLSWVTCKNIFSWNQCSSKWIYTWHGKDGRTGTIIFTVIGLKKPALRQKNPNVCFRWACAGETMLLRKPNWSGQNAILTQLYCF